MAKALGSTIESEAYPHTHLLTPFLRGDRGLLLSSEPPADILSYFDAFHPADFARAGTRATRTFTLPAGTVYSRGGEIPAEEDVPLAHSMEPGLRKLGVPSRLVKGKVELDTEFTVCREGEVLGSGQTTLLKTFGVTMAEFRVRIVACLERSTAALVSYEDGGQDDGGGDEVDVMDEDRGGVEVDVSS